MIRPTTFAQFFGLPRVYQQDMRWPDVGAVEHEVMTTGICGPGFQWILAIIYRCCGDWTNVSICRAGRAITVAAPRPWAMGWGSGAAASSGCPAIFGSEHELAVWFDDDRVPCASATLVP